MHTFDVSFGVMGREKPNTKTNIDSSCFTALFLDKYQTAKCRPRLYRQVSNIRRTLVGNEIVDNSDVVGASPVGAAPTTSELST